MRKFYFLAMLCLSALAFVGCSKKEEKKDLYIFVDSGTKVEIYKNLEDAIRERNKVVSEIAGKDGLTLDIPYGKYVVVAQNGCQSNALDIAQGRGVIDYNAENRSYGPILSDDGVVIIKNTRNVPVSVFAENAYPLDGIKRVVLQPNDEWLVILKGYAGFVRIGGEAQILSGQGCSVEKYEIN